MSIKKLLKEGITYNSLTTIFEECCSFLDFYETMKTYEIERKVSKVMALHFSGKGLHNQGARAFSKMSPMFISLDSTLETSKDQPSGNRALRREGADDKAEPKADSNHSSKCQHVNSGQEKDLSTAKKQLDCKQRGEGKEDWEDEVAKAGPRKSFTLKCTTATPLSLELDDFSSTQLKKDGQKNTTEKLKTPQSYSETNGGCTSDGNCKRLQVRAEESRGATRRSNPRKWTRRKRKGQGKTELDMKRDSVNSEKERPGKPTALSQEILSGGNENGQLAGAISLSEHDVNKDEAKRLASDETDLPGGYTPEEKGGKSPSLPSVCLKSDRSASKSFEELAIVMIGDITITVPVAPWEQEYSNPRDLAKSEMFSSKADQTEDKSVAENETEVSPRLESSFTPKKIDETQSLQSEPLDRCLQSAHGDSGTPFQEEKDEFNVVKGINVVENNKDDERAAEKVPDEEDSPAMAPSVENQIVSECQDVTRTNDSIADTVEAMRSGNSHTVTDHTSKFVDPRKSVEVEGGEGISVDCDTSGLFQHSMQPGLNPSSASGNEATGHVNISWHKLQAPVQEAVLMADRFVVSEGLPCHGVNTDDVENTRLEMQAELSSESSSTSGELTDGFYRQPPLGAERGFTPDTVQPRPDQMAWEGSVNEGMLSTPSVSPVVPGVSLNYPQGALQSYGNPYAVYHQAQQPMHPLKQYHSPFVYPPQIPHVISHPVVQAQPQVVWSPYLQYRNQLMFSNTIPQVTAATPASHFQPQIYQVWNGPAHFPCSTVPFYGNQCHQMQEESTHGMLDGGFAHQSTGIPQVNTSEEYQIPVIMNLSETAGCEVRQEPGLATISTASSASPFEPITVPSSSNFIYSAHEPTSTFNGESTGTHVVDSLVEDHHLIAEQKARGNEAHRDVDNCSGSFSMLEKAQPCDKGVAQAQPHESKHVDSCSYSSKEISIDSLPREGEADVPKQQIISLSREESATAMEKRLSPDGSSMEGVSGDSSSYHNTKEPSKENSERRQDGSSVQQVCATGLPPTPHGMKEVRKPNSKRIQDRLLMDNERSKMVASNVPKTAESAAPKILCDTNDYAGRTSSVAVDKKKPVDRVLTSGNRRTSKRVAPIEKCEATIASDENLKRIVTSSQSASRANDVAPLGVKEHFDSRRQEICSQRPVRNRGFNHRAWRPYSRKQL